MALRRMGGLSQLGKHVRDAPVSLICSQDRVVTATHISPAPGFRYRAQFPFPHSSACISSSLFSLLNLCHPWISKPCPRFHASLLPILNLLMLFSAAPWCWQHPLFFPIRQRSLLLGFSPHMIKRFLSFPFCCSHSNSPFQTCCTGGFLPATSCTKNIS